MPFWTDATGKDPKRNFRFIVELLAYPSSAKWYAKSVGKPNFSLGEAKHSYLNHTFHYPGRTTWDPIDVTLVDPVIPDAVANTMAIIQNAGYHPPADPNDISTMSKARAVGALNGVVIRQIDSEGVDMETWTLNNAFIQRVQMGQLTYDNDDLAEITLTIKYDWATCTTANASAVDITRAPAGAIFEQRGTFFSTE